MITLKDLEHELLVAINILRNSPKSINYTSYLSKLSKFLLLKRLSDRFEEEAQAIRRETGERNLAWNKPEGHQFFIPEGSRWDDLLKLSRNTSEAFNKAVEFIENANPRLEKIFVGTDWDDRELLDLIFHFSKFNLKNSNLPEPDVPGKACKFLIEKLAESAGYKGEVFPTPSSLGELLVRLLEPQQGLSICDQTCGSGGILVEWANQIKQQGGDQNSDPNKVLLYGQEVNLESWAIAKINLLLNNLYNFDIRLGDTLRDPQLVEGNKLMLFDRIIASPPFNVMWGDEIGKIDKYNRFPYGIPPKNSGDFAFIQHILATLNDTGKAAVVVPPGVLFRGGGVVVRPGVLFRRGTEGEIREKLITADLIEAVIGLPPNLLYGTGIPIVILIFNRKKPEKHKGKILFIDASREYQKGKGRNYLGEQDIAQIVSVYQAFQDLVSLEDQKGYAKVVSFEELTNNDYNLNIHRYMETPKLEVDIPAEITKLRELEAERAEAESEMNECLRALGVKL
ncbi:N-6 DNA methylase [Planktothrix agardhii]|jgi:type I restriction enzyme M protein|uniref:site-specific DNA-methyltransferase (adenine-specific) n=1 Tax=Planktothrix agardhii TaxID=1160 RepID=A0AAD1Q425_PLAAG|nr:N-6 DNA methylase [Planktothrix agardhii]MCB8764646.1 type I restriction-modification system subunit M [Planktothrix agardhii 1809]MCB8766328.1 type I restriction-modification system subunit M [Planktothrix agardhii 1809]MCB8782703.1 type I restriction-modification system subunit M [Planktothrix agardhii 1808]MCF3566269.1 type I restriction-modification system subunit M [Planktothrix agardhii 1807]CAD5963704.1 putative adenine-specific methylase MJ1220 [Planktothrix agardhii]